MTRKSMHQLSLPLPGTFYGDGAQAYLTVPYPMMPGDVEYMYKVLDFYKEILETWEEQPVAPAWQSGGQ